MSSVDPIEAEILYFKLLYDLQKAYWHQKCKPTRIELKYWPNETKYG